MPAGQIEQFIVEQIKRVGSDPAVLEGTLRQMRQQQAKGLADLRAEQKALERQMTRHHAALRKLAATVPPNANALAETTDALRKAEQRATAVREQLARLAAEHVNAAEVSTALAAFEPVWAQLGPKEQARVVRLLVERIDYDGKNGTVSITFHPSGIKALAVEQGLEVAA